MSGYDITTSSRPTDGAALDADAVIRSVLFVAVFLIVWVSFHPFPSLANPPTETSEAGNRANQIGFSLAFGNDIGGGLLGGAEFVGLANTIGHLAGFAAPAHNRAVSGG